jgi:hypothetical protein
MDPPPHPPAPISDLSDDESVPPAPGGQQVPAPQHPLWQRAAGRGGPLPTGAKRAGDRTGTATVHGRFAPISMAALELRARNEFDGASSAAPSDAGGGDRRNGGDRERRRGSTAKPARSRSRSAGRDEQSDDGAAVDYDDDESDAGGSAADLVAGAAFGGVVVPGMGAPQRRNKRAKGAGAAGRERALSVASDTDDAFSVTSSQARDAHRRAFPISGVECVGCALPSKVTPVDDFVRGSCDKMQEMALFKMAALVYCQKVAEPAQAEEVPVPPWSWKDIRAHYTMHKMDPRMQRFENMRTLAAMRKTLELQLLKEDEASGDHVLDKSNSEQIMKVITLQSKEISLLHEATIAASKSAAGPTAGASSKKRGDQ